MLSMSIWAPMKTVIKLPGFETSNDVIYLIGDPLLVEGDISIDNSGADSLVTIAKSGGDTTEITVVGVDLAINDFVIS